MRGLFSAGVMDVMMEAGLRPDGIVGVSAGACFGCNYKSGQQGRVIRYNRRFARDSRYCSLRSLLTTGDLFGARFAYHEVPRRLDVFDSAAFAASDMDYHVVCTDVETGRAVYHLCPEGGDDFLEWVRASASMPVVSRVVRIGDRRLLDGGISDSIPLEYMERQGYGRNVVVLTQPRGYRKRSSRRAAALFSLMLWRHPRLVAALRRRWQMYNAQLDYVAEAELAGRCVVIRPAATLPIGHTCHDERQMQRVYDLGREEATRRLGEMKEMWGQ